MVICWKLRNRDLRALRISSEDAVIRRSFGMASRIRRVGAARSRLRGKAGRNRHRYAVAVASGIWRPERAVRLIRRSPEKSRNEPPPPIGITYLVFQSRIFIPADLCRTPLGESSTRKLCFHGPGSKRVQTGEPDVQLRKVSASCSTEPATLV